MRKRTCRAAIYIKKYLDMLSVVCYAACMDNGKFWSLVDIRGLDECWMWQGCKGSRKCPRGSYGLFMTGEGTRQMRAHRVAFELHYGYRPKLQVLHKPQCNNPGCCNPYHLYEGTPKDNARDRAQAGTSVWVKMRQKLTGRNSSGRGKFKIRPVIVPLVVGPEAWV